MVSTAALLIVLTLSGAPGHALCIVWCDAGWPMVPPTCDHTSTTDRTPAVAGFDTCDTLPVQEPFVRESPPQARAAAIPGHPVPPLRACMIGPGTSTRLESRESARAFPAVLSSVQLRL